MPLPARLAQGAADVAVPEGAAHGAPTSVPLYVSPLGPQADAAVQQIWEALSLPSPSTSSSLAAAPGGQLSTASAAAFHSQAQQSPGSFTATQDLHQQHDQQQQQGEGEELPVGFGRTLRVQRVTRGGGGSGAGVGAALFDFHELCAGLTGPADFVALAQRYHTVVLTNVPVMGMQVRIVWRVVTLVVRCRWPSGRVPGWYQWEAALGHANLGRANFNDADVRMPADAALPLMEF